MSDEKERPPSAQSKSTGEYMSLSERYPDGMPEHIVAPSVGEAETTEADKVAEDVAESVEAKVTKAVGDDSAPKTMNVADIRRGLINFASAKYSEYLDMRAKDRTRPDNMFRYHVAELLIGPYSGQDIDYAMLIVELGTQIHDERQKAAEGSDA